jgi:hypothetical protein
MAEKYMYTQAHAMAGHNESCEKEAPAESTVENQTNWRT